MKYVVVLALGILTGLAFSHLPPYPIFRDEPETPPEFEIKQYWYLGGKRVSHEEYKSRYFNGGVTK